MCYCTHYSVPIVLYSQALLFFPFFWECLLAMEDASKLCVALLSPHFSKQLDAILSLVETWTPNVNDLCYVKKIFIRDIYLMHVISEDDFNVRLDILSLYN